MVTFSVSFPICHVTNKSQQCGPGPHECKFESQEPTDLTIRVNCDICIIQCPQWSGAYSPYAHEFFSAQSGPGLRLAGLLRLCSMTPGYRFRRLHICLQNRRIEEPQDGRMAWAIWARCLRSTSTSSLSHAHRPPLSSHEAITSFQSDTYQDAVSSEEDSTHPTS